MKYIEQKSEKLKRGCCIAAKPSFGADRKGFKLKLLSVFKNLFYALLFLNIYLAALTITAKSADLREAPPISPPSIFSFARSSAAFAAFMLPPY